MKWFARLDAPTFATTVSGRSSASPTISKKPVSYPELRRLPKAPAIRSIRFKRTTPGVAARLISAPASTPLVDLAHPLSRVPAQQLRRVVPTFHCSLFLAHAYPHAVLNRFEDPQFFKQMKGRGISDELDDALDRQSSKPDDKRPKDSDDVAGVGKSLGDRRRAMHALPMSLVILNSKKAVHKSAVVRNKIKLRLREALSLVVIRGATSVKDASAQPKIVLNTPEGITTQTVEKAAILQDWTYVLRPSLEIYRCPWPTLLENVRKALIQMRSQADVLERQWDAGSHAQRHQGAKQRPEKWRDPPESVSSGEQRSPQSRAPISYRRPSNIPATREQQGGDITPRLAPPYSRGPTRDSDRHSRSLTSIPQSSTHGAARSTTFPRYPAYNVSRPPSTSTPNSVPSQISKSPSEAAAIRDHNVKPPGRSHKPSIAAINPQENQRRRWEADLQSGGKRGHRR